MHAQLQAIATEFDLAELRLRALVERVPDEQWPKRPSPRSWSVSECVAHLNLTSPGMLPKLEAALDEARRLPPAKSTRYRRDPVGWMLWRTMGPPVRFRVSTTAAFVPVGDATPRELVADFLELQRAQLRCVTAADGLALAKVRIQSPFAERVRYNLFAALSILPRHQLRHLWQADNVAAVVAGGSGP